MKDEALLCAGRPQQQVILMGSVHDIHLKVQAGGPELGM